MTDSQHRDPAAETAALATLDAFMAAFSAKDWVKTAETLNYPHVRLHSGQVTVYTDAAHFAGSMGERIARVFEQGWNESRWDHRNVVHSGPDKVHVSVRFSRFDASGARLASYDSLWIVTRLDGHWGVQARSSYAQ